MTEAITEENKNKLKIRLQVYDTDIQLRILREEEKLYRDASKLLTMAVNKYADKLKGLKPGKDLLSKALQDLALRYEREEVRTDTDPYKNILGKLTCEIAAEFGIQETVNLLKHTIE